MLIKRGEDECDLVAEGVPGGALKVLNQIFGCRNHCIVDASIERLREPPRERAEFVSVDAAHYGEFEIDCFRSCGFFFVQFHSAGQHILFVTGAPEHAVPVRTSTVGLRHGWCWRECHRCENRTRSSTSINRSPFTENVTEIFCVCCYLLLLFIFSAIYSSTYRLLHGTAWGSIVSVGFCAGVGVEA